MAAGPDETDVVLKGQLGQFTLALLKALMTTGIYPPDHPAVQKVSGEPYLLLKRLAPTTNEITFMTASASIGDELMVDGVLSEAIPFVTLLHSSMGEVFARKFVSYFERNQLVSFSIKTRIGKEEFQKLVSVFASHRSAEEGGQQLGEDFGGLLLRHGIVHVSAMVRSEVIGGERPLPWRVKMAISRLRKDLRNIPLYAEASAQELAAAKRALIQDITRPLRRPQFLKELLANTDLITHDVEGLLEEDVRKEVIRGLHPGMLVNISWDVVGDLEKASWGAIRQTVGGVERRLDTIFKEVLKESALQLREWEPQTVKELMKYLFDKRILVYAELPLALQEEMLLDKWTNQFLGNWKAILMRLQTLTEAPVYQEYLKTLRPVYPELLRRGHMDICLELLRTMSEHARNVESPFPGRQEIAQDLLRSCARTGQLEQLTQEAQSQERERRQRAFECLALLGEEAIVALLELLWRSPSSSVRREALAALEAKGDEIHVELLEILADKGRDWFVYRNALLLIANTGCSAAVDDVRVFLRYPHPRVREEAMLTLEKFDGQGCCADLIPMLEDTEAAVRRKAISLLARLDCRAPSFLANLLGNVQPPAAGAVAVDNSIILESLAAIRVLGVFESRGVDIRVPLLNRLSRESQSRLKKWLKKETDVADDRLRCAVLDTLGAIGGLPVAQRLAPVLDDPSPLVRKRAAEVIRLLRERNDPS